MQRWLAHAGAGSGEDSQYASKSCRREEIVVRVCHVLCGKSRCLYFVVPIGAPRKVGFTRVFG